MKQYFLTLIAALLVSVFIVQPAMAQSQLGPVANPVSGASGVSSVTATILSNSATGDIIGVPRTESRTLCSDDASFKIEEPRTTMVGGIPTYNGIISKIVDKVQRKLSTVSAQLFLSITNNQGFVFAVRAALTLFIAIYGLLFMVGMVELRLHDFMIRMIKFGIIAVLLSPTAWLFFGSTVVTFFNAGTDDIINKVTAFTMGNRTTDNGGPFAPLDAALSKAASGKMAVTLLATFATGPYGVLFGLLLILSLGSFLKSLLNAMWIYVMSLAMKTLLFGLAPLFIPCILFTRTRHLFDGWINQIVNASLQPILLFIFFMFFVNLMNASIGNILSVPVCYTEFPQGWRGSEFAFYYWRFAVKNSAGQYEPYSGEWNFTGAQAPGSPVFPLDLMTILVFLILAELASRFNTIVLQIASELAGASTSMAGMQGVFSDMFSAARNAPGGVMQYLGAGNDVTKNAIARNPTPKR